MPRVKVLAVGATMTAQGDDPLAFARYVREFSGMGQMPVTALLSRVPEASRFAILEADQDWAQLDPPMPPMEQWTAVARRLQHLFDNDADLSGATLRSVLTLVLVVVGVLLVIQAMQGEVGSVDAGGAAAEDPAPVRVGVFGAAVGFIAGLTSVGTGTLFVSALAGPLRVDPHRAVAAALVAGMLTLIVSGATHALLRHFDSAIVLGTVLGSIPGVLLGTAVSHRLPSRALRGVIGAGIAAAAIIAMARMGR